MNKMIGYKGFDKDLKCRNFQYEVGKTYKEKTAELCSSGFHFCENPIDVFNYYAPTSRFALIEASGVDSKTGSDSKRAAKTITINAELSLHSLIDAAVKFTFSKIDWDNAKESNTGYRSAATNTGYQSAATNTGNQSAATNTGYQSAAEVSGKESVAIVTGLDSQAKGAKGCFLVIAEYKELPTKWKLQDVKSVKVDGKIIKADTFYKLVNGKFIEA